MIEIVGIGLILLFLMASPLQTILAMAVAGIFFFLAFHK